LTGGEKYAKNGIMSAEQEEEEGDDPIKPLFWIASSKDDLRNSPRMSKM
jgi:hypothetical protein